ncbi:transposase [Polaribacter sp. Hel1_85]|uniref:transposase n=1 Tax=Polaribacter sp. Hel1_85 TaxID=1250005 RepID=UPI0029345A73|nr:transposase [Polaribacter sp. Hel1_85]
MEQIGKLAYKDTVERIKTIPGIGLKTAIMMSVITDNFTKFENYKQLTAFVGFSPRLYQSGTSVKGKGHICKMGKPQIRKLLYLCSWSAKRVNKTCMEMYKRLKEKGKPERVIKIAIANKLIKQIFAIAKNKKYYNENHQSLYCIN